MLEASFDWLPLSVFSSGVEKCIKVWKPSATEPIHDNLREPRAGRLILDHADIPDEDDLSEDEETLAMFDTIRSFEERKGDLFTEQDSEEDTSDSEPDNEH